MRGEKNFVILKNQSFAYFLEETQLIGKEKKHQHFFSGLVYAA